MDYSLLFCLLTFPGVTIFKMKLVDVCVLQVSHENVLDLLYLNRQTGSYNFRSCLYIFTIFKSTMLC